MYCLALLLVEVDVPLVGPFWEEVLKKGDVNITSILGYNRQFWLAPALSVLYAFGYTYYTLGFPDAETKVLNLEDMASHTMTNHLWIAIMAIYAHVGLMAMLPHLC